MGRYTKGRDTYDRLGWQGIGSGLGREGMGVSAIVKGSERGSEMGDRVYGDV